MIGYSIAGIFILLSAVIALYQADYTLFAWIITTGLTLGLAASKEWRLNQITLAHKAFLKELHEISSSLPQNPDAPRSGPTPSR
jgi:hypothetical protein